MMDSKLCGWPTRSNAQRKEPKGVSKPDGQPGKSTALKWENHSESDTTSQDDCASQVSSLVSDTSSSSTSPRPLIKHINIEQDTMVQNEVFTKRNDTSKPPQARSHDEVAGWEIRQEKTGVEHKYQRQLSSVVVSTWPRKPKPISSRKYIEIDLGPASGPAKRSLQEPALLPPSPKRPHTTDAAKEKPPAPTVKRLLGEPRLASLSSERPRPLSEKLPETLISPISTDIEVKLVALRAKREEAVSKLEAHHFLLECNLKDKHRNEETELVERHKEELISMESKRKQSRAAQKNRRAREMEQLKTKCEQDEAELEMQLEIPKMKEVLGNAQLVCVELCKRKWNVLRGESEAFGAELETWRKSLERLQTRIEEVSNGPAKEDQPDDSAR